MQSDRSATFLSPDEYAGEESDKRLPGSLLKCKNRRGTINDNPRIIPVPSRSVVRRNERERNRVRMVNNGFATLRQHVPKGAKNKKMSKVETLKSAVEYIRQLQRLLTQDGSGFVPSVKTETSYAGSEEGGEADYFNDASGNCVENVYPHEEQLLMANRVGVPEATVFQTEHSADVQSPTYSLAGSPASSWASENNSSPYSHEAPDEEDILTFATWFS